MSPPHLPRRLLLLAPHRPPPYPTGNGRPLRLLHPLPPPLPPPQSLQPVAPCLDPDGAAVQDGIGHQGAPSKRRPSKRVAIYAALTRIATTNRRLRRQHAHWPHHWTRAWSPPWPDPSTAAPDLPAEMKRSQTRSLCWPLPWSRRLRAWWRMGTCAGRHSPSLSSSAAAHSSSCPPCRSRSGRSRSAQKSAKSRRPATPPRPRDAALFQPAPPPPHPSSRAEPVPTLATAGAGFGTARRGRGRFARARQHCRWCRRARRMSGGRSRRRAGAAWPRGRTEGGRWGLKGNSVNSLGV
jgi:hypothetical protein